MNDGSDLDVSTLFAGGRLCLDFVNTRCKRLGADMELIGGSHALRRWLRQAETVTGQQFCPPEAAWESGYGERALPRAVALRAALHDLVLSVIEKAPAPASALDTLNAALRENPAYSQVAAGEQGFQESAAAFRPDDAWLATIARDAADLLCHGDLTLLRQCDCPGCVRVFYDTTKNHTRRFCVEKCANRQKAAAYYRRKVAKGAINSPPPSPSLASEREGVED